MARVEQGWSDVRRTSAPPELTKPALREGLVLMDRYRLERPLAHGSMGVVWAGTSLLTDQSVALKFIRKGLTSPKALRRFVREAKATRAVRHPNVVEIHDVLALADQSPVIVMELLDGEPLTERLKRGPRLTLAEVISVMVPAVSAVGTAHERGVVHRDLKPENIVLVGGSLDHVKVVDFGIAKLIAGAQATTGTSTTGTSVEMSGVTALTAPGTLLGTPCYMSPEQVCAEGVDHRSDIWSLGIILYECLSGVLPTQSEIIDKTFKIIASGTFKPLEKVAPDVPPELAMLVGRMLARMPDDRPADLREVAAVLARYARAPAPSFGLPILALDAAELPPPRSRGPWLLIGVALLATIAIVFSLMTH